MVQSNVTAAPVYGSSVLLCVWLCSPSVYLFCVLTSALFVPALCRPGINRKMSLYSFGTERTFLPWLTSRSQNSTASWCSVSIPDKEPHTGPALLSVTPSSISNWITTVHDVNINMSHWSKWNLLCNSWFPIELFDLPLSSWGEFALDDLFKTWCRAFAFLQIFLYWNLNHLHAEKRLFLKPVCCWRISDVKDKPNEVWRRPLLTPQVRDQRSEVSFLSLICEVRRSSDFPNVNGDVYWSLCLQGLMIIPQMFQNTFLMKTCCRVWFVNLVCVVIFRWLYMKCAKSLHSHVLNCDL